MSYLLYIIFGIIPSFVWLLFYLRKDSHPESKKMILKIFLFGMVAALPAILLEIGIIETIRETSFSPFLISILSIFVGVALVEEFLKYLVVRGKALHSSELDEPLDVALYMIIAALGFAASENILILLSLGPAFLLGETFSISLLRFLGATFLHALCSGLLGFFLAMSFCEIKHRGKLLILGLTTAALLHGLYNFAIIKIEGSLSFLIPVLVLLSLAIFLTYGFKKLKKLKSICLPDFAFTKSRRTGKIK
ncbi:MAG: PrsW family intramembrane metalloprotease [bacterium]